MTRDVLRSKIKKKFGSLTRFYALAMIDQYLFNNSSITQMDDLCELTAFRKADNEFTEEQCDRLRKVLNKAGGTYKFCQDNPRFKYVSVMQVLSGKYLKVAGLPKRLLDHFKIK